jgi:hypothetical protein
VVEKTDGTTILVGEKSVVFDAGEATYITDEFDWVHFSHQDTQAMRVATPEVSA